ncbi:MAG: DNA-protecting protein DprA [Candidatus Hydrogenedentes bacterium]|nr:DNA-protecting protein DprA [Candidatus Hydrogenedentota bacterium]
MPTMPTMPTVPITAQDIVALALIPGAGRNAIHTAIRLAQRHARPLSDLFGLTTQEILALSGPGETSIAAPLAACGEAEAERAVYLLKLAGQWSIRHWTCQEPGYPVYLRSTLGNQAPPILFYQGNEALLDEQGAAIVGTRRPSLEGREWARKAAELFAEEGVTAVSGGAAGIDTEAHEAALRADGNTVVILPEGLHAHQTPRPLQRGLENGQVLLVSEFLPTAAWATPQAITRNRSIAACGRLTCVIEPGKKGGSVYTAEQTLAQGKPVFYWGGACRDGFLRNEPNAHPLGGRYGNLHRDDLIRGLTPPDPPPCQSDLFDT